MPQVISLANFHYTEKYFGEKKLEFLNASVKTIFPGKKNPENPGKKKRNIIIGNASVFFPQQFFFLGTKVCGIRWNKYFFLA
jgi:hypothetical protein